MDDSWGGKEEVTNVGGALYRGIHQCGTGGWVREICYGWVRDSRDKGYGLVKGNKSRNYIKVVEP